MLIQDQTDPVEPCGGTTGLFSQDSSKVGLFKHNVRTALRSMNWPNTYKKNSIIYRSTENIFLGKELYGSFDIKKSDNTYVTAAFKLQITQTSTSSISVETIIIGITNSNVGLFMKGFELTGFVYGLENEPGYQVFRMNFTTLVGISS